MMPQTTHRNQKMMRTPEDRTPCSRSYWISREASSCTGEQQALGPEHTSGPDSTPPHAPWLGVSKPPTSRVSSLLSEPMVPPSASHNPPRSSTQIPWSHTDHGDPHHQGVTKKTGQGPSRGPGREGGRGQPRRHTTARRPKAYEQGIG